MNTPAIMIVSGVILAIWGLYIAQRTTSVAEQLLSYTWVGVGVVLVLIGIVRWKRR